jgi:hypothetical protein
VYDELTGRPTREHPESGEAIALVDRRGRTYVPLDDEAEFERFIRERSAR